MAHWRIERIKNRIYKKIDENCFLSKTKATNNDILLIKLDKLGDYILFRNFIEEIYKHHNVLGRLVLCGNIAWKELAENLDGEFIAEFIWIDPTMLNDYPYRFSVYKKIRKIKCNKAIYCSYSRTEVEDNIVQHSGAKETIGFFGDVTNMPAAIKKLNDSKYTSLVPGPEECMFEFYRNKLFFEYILNRKIAFNRPYIKTQDSKNGKADSYIIIFPGAGHEIRRWSTSNFATLCTSLYQFYKLPIYVCGAGNESQYANDIIAQSGPFVINKVGKYSLTETIGLIKNAALAVTNDSGPLHMAMAVMTPTICISNGNHFERFCPYPKDMNMPLVVIFPDEFELKMKTEESLKSIRCKGSEIDINLIPPDKVLHALKTSNFIRHD
jgi:ADP-heptose:LPS heptosyltransferase